MGNAPSNLTRSPHGAGPAARVAAPTGAAPVVSTPAHLRPATLPPPADRLEHNLRAGLAEVTTLHLRRDPTPTYWGMVYMSLAPIAPAAVEKLKFMTRSLDVPAVCLRDDGRFAAVVGASGDRMQWRWHNVCVFSLDSPKVDTLLHEGRCGITQIAPLPGRRLALGHRDGSVAWVDAEGTMRGHRADCTGEVLDLCPVGTSLLAVLRRRAEAPVEILDTDTLQPRAHVRLPGLQGRDLRLQPAGLASPERGIPIAQRLEPQGWWARPTDTDAPDLVAMAETPLQSWSGVALGCDTRAWISGGQLILRRGDHATPQPDDVKVDLGCKLPHLVAAMAVAPGHLVLVDGNGTVCRVDFR